MAVVCGAEANVTAAFGSFPGVDHPVQFSVKGADGTAERFGPVVKRVPNQGFTARV